MSSPHRGDGYAARMVSIQLAATLSAADRRKAEERRGRFLAALLHQGMTGATLHGLLHDAGEKTSTTTVSNWARGVATLSEIQIRGLLHIIGVGPDFQPDPALVQQAMAEQDARSRLPLEQRRKTSRRRK